MLARYKEAAADWNRAIALDEGPMRPAFRLKRAMSLAHLPGRHGEAAAEALVLTATPKTPPPALYDAACVCALAGAAAKRGSEEAERHADQAILLLRRAVQQGWHEMDHLEKDPDLASLRGRKDFQDLVRTAPATR